MLFILCWELDPRTSDGPIPMTPPTHFKNLLLCFFPFWVEHWWPYNSVVSGQCYSGIFWVGAVNVWLILPEDPQAPQDTLWKWLWACHSPLDFPLCDSLCDIHPVSLSLTSWTSLSGSYWEQRTWGIWQPAWKGNLALGAYFAFSKVWVSPGRGILRGI